jgi:NAD(P)-dependent dehydrogenase (short-subunit alcohol dehydrogenase family)
VTAPAERQRHAGKVALIAGASQGGTGTGTAVRLAAEGATVAICARSEPKMRQTLAQVEAVGGRGVMFQCDLADPAGGRGTLVERTEEALGPIDYLVYVAAYGPYAPFTELTLDQLQTAVEVNMKAPMLLCQQVVTGLRGRGRPGAIVTIGTKAAYPVVGPPFPDTPPSTAGSIYGPTKAALHRLTQSVASETYGQGISANVLSPQSAIGTPALRAGGWIPEDMFEPVETMVEAVLALIEGDPAETTGQDVLSIQLLHDLGRPVYDLAGRALVDGWQPPDLPAYIARRARPFTLRPPSPDRP